MNTIMATDPHQQSFSFSRRYFTWKKKPLTEDEDDMETEILSSFRTNSSKSEDFPNFPMPMPIPKNPALPKNNSTKKKLASSIMSVLKMRHRTNSSTNLGSKIVGTLFGNRRGHVHFAFQDEFNRAPAFLVELATPTSVLVKEMASGLVRVALECDKKAEKTKGNNNKLIEEKVWRTYCNGKKCGYAMRRECGEDEWKVLNAIGPISMGAGVLPGAGIGAEKDGEMMYMRAKFERVVGSKDSEAFYMMNPDGNGGPELSIYLLRV